MIYSSIFRFGRRPTILACLFLLPVTAGATAFSPNIYFYMTVKFFCGLCGAVVMSASVLGGYTVLCNIICLCRFFYRKSPLQTLKVLYPL